MKKPYKYRSIKGKLSNDAAQEIGERLERLGEFTTEDVLTDAKDKSSPLHAYITWDTKVASQKWQLHEARNIVNSIVIVVTRDGKEEESKAFHHVSIGIDEDADPAPRYVSVQIVQRSESNRDEILARALAEARAWMFRYRQYTDVLDPIFRAIKTLTESNEDEKSR